MGRAKTPSRWRPCRRASLLGLQGGLPPLASLARGWHALTGRGSRLRGHFAEGPRSSGHTDLLFRAPLHRRPGAAYVYLLLEHQSAPDQLMAWRALTYMQRIWAAVLRDEPGRKSLPPIVTVIVHHGAGGWRAPRRLHELIDNLEALPELAPLIPDFELLIDDLGPIADDDLRSRPIPPFPKLALWLLRDGRQLELLLAQLAAWAAEIRELGRCDPHHEDRMVLARYILRVAGEIPSAILRQRIADAAPELEETMATVEEQLIQQGIRQGVEQGIRQGVEQGIRQGVEQGIRQGVEQGIRQGVEQGRTQALRDTLQRMLRARFGALEPGIEQRIAAASPAELDRWLERVISAARPADIFEP
jgi:hypothetical protein